MLNQRLNLEGAQCVHCICGLIHADLINVFEVFLPQLLLYPNPTDPLNGEAAALMMRDREHYEQKVKGACIVQLVFELFICSIRAT